MLANIPTIPSLLASFSPTLYSERLKKRKMEGEEWDMKISVPNRRKKDKLREGDGE